MNESFFMQRFSKSPLIEKTDYTENCRLPCKAENRSSRPEVFCKKGVL